MTGVATLAPEACEVCGTMASGGGERGEDITGRLDSLLLGNCEPGELLTGIACSAERTAAEGGLGIRFGL